MPIYKCPICNKIYPNKTKVAECCVEMPALEIERVEMAVPEIPKSEEDSGKESSISSLDQQNTGKGPFPIYEESDFEKDT